MKQLTRITALILTLILFTVSMTEGMQTTQAAAAQAPTVGSCTEAVSTEASDLLEGVKVCSTMKKCYKFFRNTMGYNLAVTCAILASIQLESDFEPTAVTASGYYGLVQWDPTGRKANLIKYCKANDLDYTTVSGQLAFIQKETTTRYPQKLALLRTDVANTELGAVYAAWIWCIYYEGCSTRLLKYRQELAREYWKYFTSEDYIDPQVSVTTKDVSFPDTAYIGESCSFSGTVKCSSSIDKLTIGIANYTNYATTTDTVRKIPIGSYVSSPSVITVKPGKTSYSLSKISDKWSFKDLAAGTYTFYIAAYVDGVGYTALEKTFKVKEKTTETAATPSSPKVKATLEKKDILVSWTQVQEAASYNIYRKTGTGSYEKLANVTSLTYTDSSVTSGNTYTYIVKALCDNSVTTKGTSTSIRFIKAVTPKASVVTNGIKLTWTSVSGITGYYIWRKTGDGGIVKLATVKKSVLSWKDSSAAAGTTYRYYVTGYYGSDRAVRAGKSIAFYEEPKVTVTNTAKGIKLSWNKVKGASSYRIYRKAEGGVLELHETVDGSTTSYVDEQVVKDNGAMYGYSVLAGDGTYYSKSAEQDFYRVTGVSLSKLTNSSTLSLKAVWVKNPHADGYICQYATDSAFTKNVTSLKISGSAAVSKKISSLVKGKTYYVRVRAFIVLDGKRCYSAWSNVKNAAVKQ